MPSDPPPKLAGEATAPAAPQDTVPLAAARRHRAELLGTVASFEGALAAPSADSGWRTQVAQRLQMLRSALADHIVVTEGPEGLYAELLEHAPRLARGVQGLVREHAAMLAAIDRLAPRVLRDDVDAVRARGSTLLMQIGRHRQRGADLVYEAYHTDIGGEN